MDNDQYTTDIVYPSAFGAFQSPIHLSHAAWIGGRQTVDVSAPFTYLDLGCGAGLTLCVLADCYPHATFHGVDINPKHVQKGRELASRAGLTNVEFHLIDFTELFRLDMPSVDFIGLSGVYSWLTEDRRTACLNFIDLRLSEAGAVFLHYAALPGNAQIDALYNLIREAARGKPGDSLARFQAAFATVERLRTEGARFFKINRQADAWMTRLPAENQNSMAHEVLNAQRRSLSVRDAADEAVGAGLIYVANAQIEMNHLDLVAPDSLRGELSSADPISREMMLDTIRNPHSRMDVYMREEARDAECSLSLWVDRLEKGPAISARKTLAQKTGLELMSPVFTEILRRLEAGPVRLSDLLSDPVLSSFQNTEWAVQRLAALKLVHLLLRPFETFTRPRRPVMASRLNELLLSGEIDAAGFIPFASPAAGTQVLLGLPDRLALLALTGGDFAQAWNCMRQSNQKVTLDGKAVSDPEELMRSAIRRAEQIGPAMLTNLGRLGVICE